MADAAVPETAAHEAARGAQAAVRVVAVDDKAQLLDLYRMMFAGTRYDLVATAGDGRSGVEAAVSGEADLVLMDLSMPSMDGLEAIMEVRRQRPQAHVVVVTGFGRDRLGPVATELGASDFIEKGTKPHEFLATLDVVLRAPPPRFREPPGDILDRARQLV